MEKTGPADRMGAETPLMGRSNSHSKSNISRYVAVLAAFAACALIVLVVSSNQIRESSLAQSAVKYYYVPKAAVKNNKLPLHLMIPQGKGKAAVEYTLVAAPLTSLDGNATAAPAAGGNSSSSGSFSCSVDGIKAAATKAFAEWDKCATASDYKKPNADAKRRLLSFESEEQRTESLEWVWKPAKGEPAKPQSWSASLWQMLDDKTSKNLKDCEVDASKNICKDLASCKDPVCTAYYKEPEVERICGICTMAAGGFFGCFASDAKVEVAGRGAMRVEEVQVGDLVEAADAAGSRVFSRVYFVHDHVASASILQLQHSAGVLELTPGHSLPIYTPACGERFCEQATLVPARKVRAGDRIYVSSEKGYLAQAVTGVTEKAGRVRYLLTEAGNLVVGGALASVRSTGAGPLETLPFAALDKALPGALQSPAVAAALRVILNSPALRAAEAAVERVVDAYAALASSAGRRSLLGVSMSAHLVPQALSA